MPAYKIGKLNGRFTISVYDDNGIRIHRYRLNGRDARSAELEAPAVYAELIKPQGITVAALWDGFVADRQGRAIIATMIHTWKALRDRFGNMAGDSISIEDCRAHTAERRGKGIKDGTISTELGHLRMVLRWAEKHSLIGRASPIERPTAPKRRDLHLTREQCRALIDAATMPHIKLFIVLALATGARNAALLELTWARCDFERGLIDLRDPTIDRPHKGRAIVPMNRAARAVLVEAQPGALSDFVIEWSGAKIGSVKRGLKSSARAAGISEIVSPHLLRHSAAVHMAEAGIPIEEIAQYLGHEDINVTRRVYARFSPTYLRTAAAVLEYHDLGTAIPNEAEKVVGAAWIEHATPTMSRNWPLRRRR